MVRVLSLALALLIGAALSPAEAVQSLPPGSWSGSCNSASVMGNILTAQCRSTSGDKRWSSIDYGRCPGNAVANDNGNLVCDLDYDNGSGWGGKLPPGSWSQSCRNAKMKNDELRAECRRADGGWRNSQIQPDRCPGNAVANDNGNLVCERNAGLPGGSWSQSCRNAKMKNGELRAECRRADGGWRNSSIQPDRCPDDRVANDNGNLVCEQNARLPGGSWSQSCRNGNVRNGQLYANCQRADGGWRDSSIDFRSCRNNMVANNNGRLVCESDFNNNGRLPGGSWTRSCNNGNVRNGQLYASCRRANGNWRDSSLDLSRCPGGPVGNNDGKLYCE